MKTPFWGWLEATTVAQTIQGSLMLTAALSAVHVVGMTLIAGAVLVSALRLLGVLFPDSPAVDVTRAARVGILVGLSISLPTGLLMFAARASAAVENPLFRLKMALLLSAVVFHAGVYRRLLSTAGPPTLRTRAGGAVALALWFGVISAACAYILLE